MKFGKFTLFLFLFINCFVTTNKAFSCSYSYIGPYSGEVIGTDNEGNPLGSQVLNIIVNGDGSITFYLYNQMAGVVTFPGILDLDTGQVSAQGAFFNTDGGGFDDYFIINGDLVIHEDGSVSGSGTAQTTISENSYTWSVKMMGLQELIPTAEYSALTSLYNSTGGKNWSDNCGWLTPQANWDNVYTSDLIIDANGNFIPNSSHVVDLTLSYNNLAGTIPATLANLNQVQNLALNGNNLSGNIPSLKNFTQLQYCDLDDNQLTGSIPDLSNLTQLQHFDLDYNELTGNIPDLSNLTQLQYFDLDDNELTGSIPNLKGLLQLQLLHLDDNELSGSIPDLSDLTQLYVIDLHSNHLLGEIPGSLWGLLNVFYIDLSNNQLTGTISTNATNLSGLNILNLFNNNLSGNIPDLSTIGPNLVVNVTNNWLNIQPGTPSASNINSMIDAGEEVDFIPQGMGIDISTANALTVQDFINLRAQGFHFAVVSGWGGVSSPINAKVNLQNARNAGLLTAGYCLLNFATNYDGARQVRNALAAFDSEAAYLGFVAIDVEFDTSHPNLYPIGFFYNPPDPSAQAAAIIRISQAVQQVTQVGLQPIIYSNPNSWTTITGPDNVDFTGLNLWDWKIGDKSGNPDPITTNNIALPIVSYGGWTSRLGKQYQQNLVLSNPNVKVDLDVFNYSAFPPLPNPVYIPLNLNASIQGTKKQVDITWNNSMANLEESLNLNGSWSLVPNATSPYSAPMTDSIHFYRVR